MKRVIESRLKELKEEYQKGQSQMVALEQETTSLRNTMLRISGAIQVLEELLGENVTENPILVNNGLGLSEDAEKGS